jgi:hypothetical protein
VCINSYGKKSGLGVLSGGGFMFTVPLNLIRKILNKVITLPFKNKAESCPVQETDRKDIDCGAKW